MYTTITARRAGTCRRCGKAFEAGTRIRYGGRDRTYHLKAECEGASTVAAAARFERYEGLSHTDEEETAARGYHNPRAVSHYTRFSSGAEVFTNKRGRCEDAPCCGCCS